MQNFLFLTTEQQRRFTDRVVERVDSDGDNDSTSLTKHGPTSSYINA
jgi:hypothetical protein